MSNCSDIYESDLEEEQPARKYLKIMCNAPINFPIVGEVGAPVEKREIRKAGKYLIGPEIMGNEPVKSIVQYLGRKEHTYEFNQLKILQLNPLCSNTMDEMLGKELIHTEFSILSLLKDVEGIVRCHGLFTDIAYEEETLFKCPKYTGKVKKRIVLVLDCCVEHRYCDESSSFISLQEYVKKLQKIPLPEALYIFHNIVEIVQNMHQKNVIHRDLKLGNIILNQYSRQITIINFGLSKYLSNENQRVYDQKGSPAYISPEIFYGAPYNGKSSDMWALGVVFYILLSGNFPFYKKNSKTFIERIMSGLFEIPKDYVTSTGITDILRGLLNTNPAQRLTAKQLLGKLDYLINRDRPVCLDQLVPFVSGVLPPNLKRTESLSLRRNHHIVQKLLGKPNYTGEATHHADVEDDAVVPVIKKSSIKNVTSKIKVQSLTSKVATPTSRANHPSWKRTRIVRKFIFKLNFKFEYGMTNGSNNDSSLNFNGILTFEFAINVIRMLMINFGDDFLVRQIVINADDNIISKLRRFLFKCGIKVEISIFGLRICRKQKLESLILITRLLNLTGYNSLYFTTPPFTSR